MGGSFARACKKENLAGTVIGFGRNRANLEEGKKLNIIDRFEEDIETAVRNSDLVIFCCPVASIISSLKQSIPALKPGCIVTDVGSVKTVLVEKITGLVPEGVHYVGSHPIAGSEKAGLKESRPDLFQGNKCILTPVPSTDPAALETIRSLWKELGMEMVQMDAGEHDFIFGAVSHLPHVIAYALMNTLGSIKTENYNEIISFSGAGLKDSTRIASSDPFMWRDICLSNREPVLKLIDQFKDSLDQVKVWIEKQDGPSLERSFSKANKYRFNLVNRVAELDDNCD